MVPGMTERERLAADVARLAWLVEARFGPANPIAAPQRPPIAVSPLSGGRRALTAALLFGQRLGALPSQGEQMSAEPSPTPAR